MISAKVIADSINEFGNRITTLVLTYPRIVHSEFMTHRVFSRNAASSRAIPFKRMAKMIEENPFIPIAWQKDHPGMQGTEYITDPVRIEEEKNYWLQDRNHALLFATRRHERGVTKQLINRPLEPFMWYTCIVTATEWENFFELRCPQYETFENSKLKTYRSRKDLLASLKDFPMISEAVNKRTEVEWLQSNRGGAEIHISLLAEAIWDARNESIPKLLKASEWHIPFGDQIDIAKLFATLDRLNPIAPLATPNRIDAQLEIATARCAWVSYMNHEGSDDYEKCFRTFKMLKGNRHLSPFEHCAKAMTRSEYESNVKGILHDSIGIPPYVSEESEGWCKNFRGFIQLRTLIE